MRQFIHCQIRRGRIFIFFHFYFKAVGNIYLKRTKLPNAAMNVKIMVNMKQSDISRKTSRKFLAIPFVLFSIVI